MAFSNKFMNNSPLRKEEPKNDDNLEYTNKSDSGMSDAEYAKYFNEGSIHRPNLDEVVVNAPKNKRVGETALVDTSKGSSFPTGASTETIKQWYANNPPKDTITKVEGKKGLSGMKEAGKEFLQDLKTLTGNPFDGIRSVLRTDDSGGDFPTSLQDLKALKELADKDDGSVNSKQAKSILLGTKGFNTVSSLLPPVLAADTAASLISGDPVAAILKKGKYLKPVSKILKKNKLGKQIYDSLDEVYYGYKGAKKLL
tara:strand:+ start:369 stop:1133 length:765 start_codon:yes stop_codon:yes gene_type:complete